MMSTRAPTHLRTAIDEFRDTRLDDGRRFYAPATLNRLFAAPLDVGQLLASVSHLLRVLDHDRGARALCPICKCPLARQRTMADASGKPGQFAAETASPALRAAFKGLVSITALTRPHSFTRRNAMYEPGDELAPILSEAFLYNLVGKDDARTIRGRLRRLGVAAGFDEIGQIL